MSAEVQLPDGYRLLLDGEVIRKGDKCWQANQTWGDCSATINLTVSGKSGWLIACRKVEAKKEDDVSEQIKVEVGQVRVGRKGEYEVLAVHGKRAWVKEGTCHYTTWIVDDCAADPIKRKVPVLAWEVPPWIRRLNAAANGWYLVKTDAFTFGLPHTYAPPLEAERTSYTRDELNQARREAGL